MAMNKKEREEFDNLRKQSRVNRALRWSDFDSAPDLPIPEHVAVAGGYYVNGWSINTYESGRVYQSWSNSINHGDGWVLDGKSPAFASQRPIAQFSTKERALKALRVTMERRFADRLANIDSLIEQEEKE